MRKASLFVIVAVFASMASAGTAFPQTHGSADFEGLVDVGGYRLFLRCTGEGSPTVILDAAAGSTSQTWDHIQPAVASFTRVCSYDRAGRGKSDRGPVPRTTQTMVDELRTLLRNAGIEGPYVLVGHSLGGLNMQLFARQYPREVAGVVLVDATPADIIDRFGEVLTPEQLELVFPAAPERHPEGLDFRAGLAEVQGAPPFPNVPLIVLARTVFPPGPPVLPNEELARLWNEMQQAQGSLSPQGEVIFVEGAGHFIHLDRPDVVVDSIRRVVEAARTCGPPGEEATATIIGLGSIVGTPGDDVIVGSGGHDVIVGRGGNDIICGRGGSDRLDGGGGDDVILGGVDGPPFAAGGSADTVIGGPGDDRLLGLSGPDSLFGGPGDDEITGFGGDDRVFGGNGSDTIFGGPGRDLLSGENGDDEIYGNFDSDTILGGNGNDFIDGDNRNEPPPSLPFPVETSPTDTCFGGRGRDTILNCEQTLG